ncbi:MAG TPA: hypothetical protein VNN15_03980 [Solirubrobacterales bacterium]|nr:hypothetical protein [Solirubrobacterales bacterium]
MRKPLRKAIALATLLVALACATAYAITAEVGPVWVSATVTMQPRELPRRGNAPISLSTVTRVGTHDGSTPPTLKTLAFLFDKNGTVNTKGLPVCTAAKLEGTTPAQARKKCAGALVGEGKGKARVTLPGKAPFTISTPLSLFNAPPDGGRPTLIAHAYETVPVRQALLVPITIERVSKGRYGFQVRVEMPEVAGGYGAPILAEATINATRKLGGKEVGYINAHCVGGRLQVYGTARFTNGDFFPVTLTSPCHFPR